ncbi:hypothetical protein NYG90_03230 [Helicobacter sp. XJK30-2]|uniref:Uncharacterized protein n=1 Tax=Helicobacter zhangjianzhongii TaxID=2974574 RepID=A0ACC6FS07_9HELI|nr:hypothetical protein [Helicobacter sp. XJK30-2]MDL0081697.1 hypothetical protein [Helicobacter sp. XJK30-2]
MLVLGELESTFLSSLRGSEATEAIHTQKADSSMDRHADKSARDDKVGGECLASERKTSNARKRVF